MKKPTFKKILAAVVAAAHMSSSFAGSYYLIVPVHSYASTTVGGLAVDPSSLAFSGTELGDSTTRSVTIRNTGQVAQSSPAIAISQNSAEYVVSSNCPETLDVGQSCSADVTYFPVQNTLPGKLRVAYEPVGERLVSLSGQALFDDLEGSKALDFGTVQPGKTAVVSATLSNQGTRTAALNYGSLPSTVTRAGTCSDILPAKTSCDLTFSFKAESESDRTRLDHLFKVQAKNSAEEFQLTAQPLAAGKITGAGAYDYGAVALGSSAAKTYALTNVGDVAVELFPGALPANVTRTGSCATSLGAGQSCNVTFTWAPVAAGALNASTELGSTLFTLTGTAITAAALTDSGSTAFGTVLVGETSAKTVTITNSGQQASSLSYGALPAGVSKTGTCSTTLAGGANCTVTLTWAPASAGTLSANYTVTGTNNTVTLALSGTAQTKANLTKSGDADFGTVLVGETATKTATISNGGQQASSLTYSALPAGVTKGGTCSTSLAGGANCTVTLTWAPTASGSLSANYTISGTNNTLTVALSGASITPASLSGGSSQAYGTVVVGSSAANTWTISNSGKATASLTYGALPAGVTKSGTCPTTLAGGASCTVILTWAPTAAGALNASYTVGNQTLTLTGTAAAQTPAANLSKTSHAFGSIMVNQIASTTVDITNTGNVALTLPASVGTATAPYAVTDACGTSLAVGASCTATITYSPTAGGAHNSSVTINTGAAGSKTVTVNGTGLTPASLSGGGSQAYGTVTVGSSAAKTWTISNSGGATASLTYGALPAGVTKSGTCSTTLSGGASCTVTLTWAPTAATPLNATYAVNSQNNSISLGLTGTAVAAGNSLSIGNYSSSSYGYATQYAGFPLAFGSMNPSFPGLGTVTGVFWAGSGSPSITVTFSAPVSASAITISINGVSYRLSAQYSTFFRGSISSAQFNALPKSGSAMIALSR